MHLLHSGIVNTGDCAIAALTYLSANKRTQICNDFRKAKKMAHLYNIRSHEAGIANSIAAAFRNASLRFAQHRAYRQTVAQLSTLGDRELADLGLHRSMIASVAAKGAYGY